jgi:hypothetical protein
MSSLNTDPSPKEIAEACAKIQEGWTETQRTQRRLAYGRWGEAADSGWTAPEVAMPRDSFGNPIVHR